VYNKNRRKMGMPTKELNEIKERLVSKLDPIRVYLFGSHASGTQRDDSDFDIYVIVPDGSSDIAGLTISAYKAIRDIKRRPVDIIVGTESRFDERKRFPSIEQEVDSKGMLLYGQ